MYPWRSILRADGRGLTGRHPGRPRTPRQATRSGSIATVRDKKVPLVVISSSESFSEHKQEQRPIPARAWDGRLSRWWNLADGVIRAFVMPGGPPNRFGRREALRRPPEPVQE